MVGFVNTSNGYTEVNVSAGQFVPLPVGTSANTMHACLQRS